MIAVRRAKDREHDLRHRQEVWLTFSVNLADPLNGDFGTDIEQAG
jgi:hypothetical protein